MPLLTLTLFTAFSALNSTLGIIVLRPAGLDYDSAVFTQSLLKVFSAASGLGLWSRQITLDKITIYDFRTTYLITAFFTNIDVVLLLMWFFASPLIIWIFCLLTMSTVRFHRSYWIVWNNYYCRLDKCSVLLPSIICWFLAAMYASSVVKRLLSSSQLTHSQLHSQLLTWICCMFQLWSPHSEISTRLWRGSCPAVSWPTANATHGLTVTVFIDW